LGATSRDRGLHAGAASRAAAFSEPDLPGSTLDTILPEIAEDVFRGWTRRM
jgi:hypothetical protein